MSSFRIVLLAAVLGFGCIFSGQSPAGTEIEVIQKASAVRPDRRQLAWQELEFTCFIHFGINTFRGVEWGSGMEDIRLFNPSDLDTDQWCENASAAGMKLILFTAKHHDGFCLWQTRYTENSVTSTPWKDGKGDVLRQLSESCRKYGLKLGIYLSPADLYQIENEKGLYGNLSKYSERTIPRNIPGRPFGDKRTFTYRVDDYNEYFMNQLFEVLTEYGPIHEVWFDGAHPKRKGGQTYTHSQWYDLIRRLAPDAVIAIKGPDVRWCGNEAGHTRPAEWSVIPIGNTPDKWDWPDMMASDLGSVGKIKQTLDNGGFLHWYPAETNTSIRHGWFWRDEKQYVKSTQEILDIWYRSVGGNTLFLLNVPPDRRGHFAERDCKVLNEVGRIIRETFSVNLAAKAHAQASSVKGNSFSADNILDGDTSTCWMPADDATKADVTITLDKPVTFNRIMLQEQIAGFGQRIAAFTVDAYQDGKWVQLAQDTVIGYKRICRTALVTTDKVRVRILDSRTSPTLSTFGLYYEPVGVSKPKFTRDRNGNVTIYCDPAGPVIRYSLDGSEPTADSIVYAKPIPLGKGGIVKAAAFGSEDRSRSDTASVRYDICKAKWKVISASSEQAGTEGKENAIDGDPDTIWHSQWSPTSPRHPHEIVIDLGEVLTLKGFTYLPRTGPHPNGTIKDYAFYVSDSSGTWGDPIVKSQFGNIKNNPVKQYVRFEESVTGRFIRLVALSEINDQPWASAAEIGVITKD